MIQERARRTREHVLNAAAEEFTLRGYANTALQTVATRIGMTKGALYAHFPSKEHLANALLQHFADVWDELRATWGDMGDPAPAGLLAAALGLARRLESDVRMRAALRLFADAGLTTDRGARALTEIRDCLAALAHRGQEEGTLLPSYTPDRIVRLLLAVAWGAPYAPGAAPLDDRLTALEEDWAMLLDLLSPHPQPALPVRPDGR
ncbi:MULTISPECIES: TetR/AcrR family transcriptional regulator [Actinomycetes]|uniref:TetR family transcriptional regulator n=1 Tax=Streptomyces nondiastaticus TaxID=3154512 RepID=A0ABW6TWS5_9ACTN|nr:TetR/AcrR family transcriptional regulator [Streptosporangium nondiastaticum]